MLTVTVYLSPQGNNPRELLQLEIVNDNSGTPEKGNYQLTVKTSRGRFRDRVVGVHRDKGLVHLVNACLLAVERHL